MSTMRVEARWAKVGQVRPVRCDDMQLGAIGREKDELIVEQAHVPHALVEGGNSLPGGRSGGAPFRATESHLS